MVKGRHRKRSSTTVAKQHFPIGEFAKRRKEIKEAYLSNSETLKREHKKHLRLTKRVKRLQEKNDKLQRISENQNKKTIKHLLPETKEQRKRKRRQGVPSITHPVNSEKLDDTVKSSSANNRKLETIEACSLIHGSTVSDLKPCLDGLWYTLVNTATTNQLERYISYSRKATKAVQSLISKEVRNFEKSKDNIIRSVKVLYEKGLISKEKYKSTRIILYMKSLLRKGKARRHRIRVGKCSKVPKLLSYDKLISFIKSVNTCPAIDLASVFCVDLDEDQQINGAYRDLEQFVLELAEMYITVDKELKDSSYLLMFGEQKYNFKLTIGADGAPFGKDDEATAWVISFMNVGVRIGSKNENFLLAGANCSESHIAMIRYAKKLCKDIDELERKKFTIAGYSVTFKISLVPSDMKWLATFSGELSNAAHYFSTFANVNYDDIYTINGSLGFGKQFTWQPWDYSKRVEIAKLVEAKKEELNRTNLADSTKRNKILAYIREMKSRQEYLPIIDRFVDFAYSEPLHSANNACQQLHNILLQEAVTRSDQLLKGPVIEVSKLPDEVPLKKFLLSLKSFKATRLYKKIVRWIKEGRKKKFDYRFTGKETKIFCHKFMYIIDTLKRENDKPSERLLLTAVAFAAQHLRDAIAIFNRVTIDRSAISQLERCCLLYFKTCSLLLKKVTPTTWTIGYAIPFHTKLLFDRYHVGLGINTMQGREAKHVDLASYSKHTTRSHRWPLVMRHEYINTVWLRKADIHSFRYNKSDEKYVPKEVLAVNDKFCYCGFSKSPSQSKCFYCSSRLYNEVSQTALHGELTKDICNLLSAEC